MTKSRFEDLYKYLRNLIKDSEFKTHVFFVGECVRDFLMGNEIKNTVEIVVDLNKGEVNFANWLAKKTNCHRQTLNPIIGQSVAKMKLSTTQFNDIILNITHTKITSGNCADNFGTILDDSITRDVTVNAIYLDISEGEIFDPLKGIDDMSRQILTTTNVPDSLFKSDPIMMMRIIKYASQFQWGIDKVTWLSIVKNAHLMENARLEHIKDELDEILLSSRPSYGLNRLYTSGILNHILPLFYSLTRVGRNYIRESENVWKHTIETVDLTEPILVNRLGALFHDIGKSISFKLVNGRPHFYGHECSGCSLASQVMKGLGYPKAVIDMVQCVIKNHMRFSMVQGEYTPSNKIISRFLNDVGENKDLVMDVIKADFISHSKYRYADFIRIAEAMKEVETAIEESKIVLPISGKDVVEALGIKPGPVVGRILELTADEVKKNPSLTKEEALDLARTHLALVY